MDSGLAQGIFQVPSFLPLKVASFSTCYQAKCSVLLFWQDSKVFYSPRTSYLLYAGSSPLTNLKLCCNSTQYFTCSFRWACPCGSRLVLLDLPGYPERPLIPFLCLMNGLFIRCRSFQDIQVLTDVVSSSTQDSSPISASDGGASTKASMNLYHAQ